MKHETLYENEEFEIFADESRTLFEREIPYLNQCGEWVDDESTIPVRISINDYHEDRSGEENFPPICPKTISRIKADEYRGRVENPKESFIKQIKFRYDMEAVEAICKYYQKELDQAERDYYQERVNLLENN